MRRNTRSSYADMVAFEPTAQISPEAGQAPRSAGISGGGHERAVVDDDCQAPHGVVVGGLVCIGVQDGYRRPGKRRSQ